ncbi:MAG: NUDIX domain-containing protein [Bacteroidales bacterium]|nr:NUDIX domain-containing protein [Bacteroidales bacterium]
MQRYVIFNKHNKIVLTKNEEKNPQIFEGKIIDCDSELLNSTNFSSYFDDECYDNLILVCKKISIQEVFLKLSQPFYFVFAAGGIVENEKGELLFMHRNGMWDLPKGHWEKGESLESTAKREVIEECGIQNLQIGDFICNSMHTYYMHHRYELKQTSWYKMYCSSNETLLPQTQEGIKELRWVKKEDLDEILSKSYPNIRNIFIENRF